MTSPWNFSFPLSNSDLYTELRLQENRSKTLMMINGQMLPQSQSQEQGVSARSFFNGCWGFASYPQIQKNTADQVLSQANKNARFLGRHAKSKSQLVKMPGAHGSLSLATQKPKFSPGFLNEHLQNIEDHLTQKYPDVSNRTLRLFQQDFIKQGYNSEGADFHTHYCRSYLYISLGMNSHSGLVEMKEIFGDRGELEDTLWSLEKLKPQIEILYKHLLEKSKGVHAEAGIKDVVMHSKLAGILAHEAVGHTTEADIVMGGSIAANLLNEQVASEKVSLVDYANKALGRDVPMPVLFDDEGTLATDTVIIENGVLKTFMNSKETAHHYNQKATGHSRAWGFNDEPLIRMRNTAIVPGNDKLADMIASIDDGYYLMDHGNGQADSTSEFMFSVPFGYEIKKGKIGRAILDTTISGVAFDMLKTVSMVSDEMSWVGYGTCGKKQPMTVGMGGPAVKCKVAIGGK